jgi:hypothetical protein
VVAEARIAVRRIPLLEVDASNGEVARHALKRARFSGQLPDFLPASNASGEPGLTGSGPDHGPKVPMK